MSIIFENQYLRKEFVINNRIFSSGPIFNKISNMNFVPDGNGSEFIVRFIDGDVLTAKSVPLADTVKGDGKIKFTFEKKYGCSVSVSYHFSKSGKQLKKQISLVQYEEKPIDFILLENVGIINSETHYTVPEMEDCHIDGYYCSLGQPFYIDSLYYGCEFPATENKIVYGAGRIKYFLGKQTTGEFKCPYTIVGAARSNEFVDVRSDFFDYIDLISVPSKYRVQYNSWYDNMRGIDAKMIEKSFYEIEKNLSSLGVAPLDAYAVDDGWNDYKAGFWTFNDDFPNELNDFTLITDKLSSKLGLWLGPRGGYELNRPFAKRIEKSKNGYYNSESGDICVGSETYLNKLKDFLIETTNKFDLDYWKLDGFCLKPCKDSKHDHITGGKNEMYFVTEMWERWIEIFQEMRKSRKKQGKELWINMTCYVHPSPFWLRYVNSIWIQNSDDIGFSNNIRNQAQVESEMTYRDSKLFDFLCARGLQFPTRAIYNHEPIYGISAKVNYTDEQFEKYVFMNAARGQAFNELYLSWTIMNENKWASLAKMINWSKNNYDILKNATFLGGIPEENNIYGYTSFDKSGNGVIALRNPTDDKVDLTLTLNKLMGTPKCMESLNCYNIYNKTAPETDEKFSYGDKIDMSLLPFEVKIIQFGKENPLEKSIVKANDFTVTFDYCGENKDICKNDDVEVFVKSGLVHFRVDETKIKSNIYVSKEKSAITLVREKNKMLKIYVNGLLDCSKYDENQKDIISTNLSSDAENFAIIDKTTPYNEIRTIEKGNAPKKRGLFSKK